MPSIEGLDYDALTLRRTPVTPDVDATDRAIAELRLRASQLEPVTDRGVDAGDTVTLDLTRRGVSGPEGGKATHPEDRHENVSIELGTAANPPGLDAELTGLQVGESKAFELAYPADYEQTELAGTRVAYEVVAKAIHRRRLPDLDDEFARSVGEFDTLEALKTRVATDLERDAAAETNRGVRHDLMTQLAARVTVEVPEALVNREIGRRLEQIATRLAQQRVDPRTAHDRLGCAAGRAAGAGARDGARVDGARRGGPARIAGRQRRRRRTGTEPLRRAAGTNAGGGAGTTGEG